MKAFTLFIISAIMLFPSVSVADNVVDIKMEIYKDQQRQLINTVISSEADKRYTFDELKNVTTQREFSRYMNKMEINFKENDTKISDAEFKLSELKIKVLEASGTIPAWWKENEDYCEKKRSEYRSK